MKQVEREQGVLDPDERDALLAPSGKNLQQNGIINAGTKAGGLKKGTR